MRIIQGQTENVAIDSLKPHPRNPREGDIGAIHESINNNGFYGSVLAQKSTGFILAGNHRWQAMLQAGATEIPVTWIDVDDDHALRILLADNRTNDMASYNEEELANILEQLIHDTGTLAGTGYDGDALDELLDDLGRDKELRTSIDEDEIPEPPTEAVTQVGDLWILGNHRLLCGDSTNIQHVERLMNGQKADMVFTDPPYGFNYTKKSDGRSIANDGSEFEQVISDALSLVQVDTAYVCGDAKTAGAFLRATSCLGEPKNCIVWVKPIQHRMHRYEPCHELIWFWGDNGSPFYGANVFEAKREIQKFHPTVKPVELIEYCFGSHKDKKVVLDLFGGSGTTLIACEKTSRHCRMMELDPAYCDVIIKRWEDYTGQKAKLESAAKGNA